MLFLSQPLLPLGQTPHPLCLCPQENQPSPGLMGPPSAVRKLGYLSHGGVAYACVIEPEACRCSLDPPLFCSSSGRKEKPADPVEWTVMDVVEYFTEAGFPEQATAFQEQVNSQPSVPLWIPGAGEERGAGSALTLLSVCLSHSGNRWKVFAAHAADRCADWPVHPPGPSPENLRAPHQGAAARPL